MKTILLFVCVGVAGMASMPVLAQATKPERIRCEASYMDFTQEGKNAQYERVNVEIDGNKVRVTGAPQFAAVYTVSNVAPDRLSFEIAPNSSISGVYDRKAQRLNIWNRGEKQDTVRQVLMGSKCSSG